MPGKSNSRSLVDHLPIARDVSAFLGSALPRLIKLAFEDATTSLLTRAALKEIGKGYDDRADAAPAVVFLDLTGFKAINDELGHDAGDAALKLVGRRLIRISKRSGSIPFRYGGDEFVILAPHDKVDLVTRNDFRWRFSFEGQRRPFRASVGSALPGPDEGLEAVVKRADHACKVSKYDNRSRHVRWSSTLALEPRHSLRYRCPRCGASITIEVAKARFDLERARSCHNCLEPR